jgi:2-polyprenyl-3-methyl-5-hydroxy-6-metoxy-1,4-benzoquinol methylase
MQPALPLGSSYRDHSPDLALPGIARGSHEAGVSRGPNQNAHRSENGKGDIAMISYQLLYRLGFAPWESRAVAPTWQGIADGADALTPGRALDVGCGTGRDAVYLATRGWQVTAVDIAGTAIAKARQRAAQEHVEVDWITGDVSQLGMLGLKPGYMLLYDFGCIQGLPDPARRSTLRALTELAAPGAMLLLTAFARGRRLLLPRGMDQEDVIGLGGEAWALVDAQPIADPSAPPPVRRAHPTQYHLTRNDSAPGTPSL